LFEGDRPAPPRLSGPGEKFALGDSASTQEIATAELPEAYGTGRLFLTSRDPHWLYAHWDFTREQQRRYNAQSADGHLILRAYAGSPQGRPVSEIHVHPESRHWFAHVELGYYRRGRKWTRVATAATTQTPPDTHSTDTNASFATIPVDAPFEKLLGLVRGAACGDLPLAQALEELQQREQSKIPAAAATASPAWTAEQARALAEVIRADTSPCAWMDSLAISELMQGPERPEGQVSSPGAAGFGLHAWPAGAEESVSSPSGGPPLEAKGFWFNVNAELVIYGATERDATVTLGGRRINLRPDGTFSIRFALPDGKHALAVVAVSSDGKDGRAAGLKFTRSTEIAGEVGTHPQDPALQPPTPENVG
jgi:hypothetical protein